ncbi:hypothetical protein RCIX1050 [Methanocella arvoryzae MRE50]|uniref:Uncharacterized protein n=1 Tax=Methanocella arvoryzae (strain DSM 22066 / NBRC 105507 / MRE50) TaxID=351160 RepID=Q0W5G7_METAR|nr:hypothetical protein RCIX1050 [Methanocella arvoryzae MRE50]
MAITPPRSMFGDADASLKKLDSPVPALVCDADSLCSLAALKGGHQLLQLLQRLRAQVMLDDAGVLIGYIGGHAGNRQKPDKSIVPVFDGTGDLLPLRGQYDASVLLVAAECQYSPFRRYRRTPFYPRSSF